MKNIQQLIDEAAKNYSKGEYDKAMAAGKSAIDVDSKSYLAHYWLARSLSATQLDHQAKAEYMQVMELQRDYAPAYFYLATIHFAEQNIKEGAKLIEQANRMKALRAQDWYEVGVKCYGQGELALALDYFHCSSNCDPNFTPPLYCAVEIKYKQGLYKEVINDADRLIAMYPQHEKAYYYKALALGGLQEFASSVEYYLKVLEINPKCTGAYHNIGLSYIKLQQIDQAVSMLEKAILSNPDSYQAYLGLGKAFVAQGNVAQAREVYNQLIVRNPEFTPVYSHLAYIQFQNKEYKEAALNYGKAANSVHSSSVDHFNFGTVLEKIGKLDEAIKAYTKAIERDNRNVNALLNIAGLHDRLGNYSKAEENYERVVAIDPNNANAQQGFALAILQQGRNNEAVVNALETMTKLRENQVFNNTESSKDSHYQKHQVDLSDSHQDSEDAYVNKGMILSDLERQQEAIDCYDKVILLSPNTVETYYNIGRVYTKSGDRAFALSSFSKAISLNPSDPDSYNAVAEVLQTIGRLEESQKYLSIATSLEQGEDIKDILKKMNIEDISSLLNEDISSIRSEENKEKSEGSKETDKEKDNRKEPNKDLFKEEESKKDDDDNNNIEQSSSSFKLDDLKKKDKEAEEITNKQQQKNTEALLPSSIEEGSNAEDKPVLPLKEESSIQQDGGIFSLHSISYSLPILNYPTLLKSFFLKYGSNITSSLISLLDELHREGCDYDIYESLTWSNIESGAFDITPLELLAGVCNIMD